MRSRNLVPNFAVSYSSSFSGGFGGPATTDGSGQVTLTSWAMAGTAAGRRARPHGQYGYRDGRWRVGECDRLRDLRVVRGRAADLQPALRGCHGGHGAQLDYRNSRASTVGVVSTCDVARFRVSAGNAAASVLYLRVISTPNAPPDAADRTPAHRDRACCGTEDHSRLDQQRRPEQLEVLLEPPVQTALGCIPEFRNGNRALVVIRIPAASET